MSDTPQNDSSSKQTLLGGAPSAHESGELDPSPQSPTSDTTSVGDPSSNQKSLFQKSIFWGCVAAVIVLVVVVLVATTTGNNAAKHSAVTTVTASRGPTASTNGSDSTDGSNSTKGSRSAGAPGTSPTATQPSLPIGATQSYSANDHPVYGLTVTQFVDPAQPADPSVTPKRPGDIFVAVAFTFTNTGVGEVSQDIYNDSRLYDSTGQGFDGDFENTASGPGFPVGIISISSGATTSGWIMFEVPASSTGFKVTFTPTEGAENQAPTTWKLT